VKRQVEIVGAGIAGLTTGLAFAQKGWRVRVHERDSTLRLFGEGVHLWRNGLRVLDALGLLAPVTTNVLPAFRHERRDSRGKTFSSCDFDPAFRLYLPLQPLLLAALYVALIETGGEVQFNSRAIGADPDGRLEFANGRRVRADLIVGADGINSVIRDSPRPAEGAPRPPPIRLPGSDKARAGHIGYGCRVYTLGVLEPLAQPALRTGNS